MAFEATFSRCPHDKQNPYVMISRALIRDKSLSPECRMLIIYLLTHTEGFTINTQEIMNHFKGHWGRNRIYELVTEAIEAGYLKREEIFEKNLKQGCRYFVSEFPKFKECLRNTENGETEDSIDKNRRVDFREAENRHLNKEQSCKNKQEETTTPFSPKKIESSSLEKPSSPNSVEEELKKTKLTPEQQKEAIEFYRVYKEELHASAKSSVVGLIVTLVKNGAHKEKMQRASLIDQRKEWAQKNAFGSANGCLEVFKDGIQRVSGAFSEFIKFNSNHEFWKKIGLGLNEPELQPA